jgi:polyisoprenoid-binding protein YceI
MTQANLTQASAAPSALSIWDIDPAHASASFRVRHLMVSHVRGQLGPVSGTVWLDARHPSRSRVRASIDARGIDTREPKRDEHLRSADFFDVDRYPEVSFESTRVEPQPDDSLLVTGNLTIRDVTRSILLEVDPIPPAVKDPWGNTKRGATARATLDRKDFGLSWNMALEAGGVVVGDRVAIEIEVELVERKPAS